MHPREPWSIAKSPSDIGVGVIYVFVINEISGVFLRLVCQTNCDRDVS